MAFMVMVKSTCNLGYIYLLTWVNKKINRDENSSRNAARVLRI